MQDSLKNLVELNPIIDPAPVSSWPPAPGWYILSGLLLLGIFLLIFFRIKKWLANAYRRQALGSLEQVREAWKEEKKDHLLLRRINEILKRVAMVSYSREQVASLSGRQWLEFLSKTCKKSDFLQAPGKCLADPLYWDPGSLTISEKERAELLNLSKTWIQQHRV